MATELTINQKFSQELGRPFFNNSLGMPHELEFLSYGMGMSKFLSDSNKIHLFYKASDVVQSLWKPGRDGKPGDVNVVAIKISFESDENVVIFSRKMQSLLEAGSIAANVGMVSKEDVLRYTQDALFSLGTYFVNYSLGDEYKPENAKRFMNVFEGVVGEDKAKETILTALYSKAWQRVSSDSIETVGSKSKFSGVTKQGLVSDFDINLHRFSDFDLFADRKANHRAQLTAFKREVQLRRIGTDAEKMTRLFRKTLVESFDTGVLYAAYYGLSATMLYAMSPMMKAMYEQRALFSQDPLRFLYAAAIIGIIGFGPGVAGEALVLGKFRRPFVRVVSAFVDAYKRHARGEKVAPDMVLVGSSQ